MKSVPQKQPQAYKYLRALVHGRGMKLEVLCGPAGIKVNALSKRLNCKLPWTTTEMWAIMDFLKRPDCEIWRVFPKDPYADPFEEEIA